MGIYRIVGDRLLNDKEFLQETIRNIPKPDGLGMSEFSLTLDHVINSLAPPHAEPSLLEPSSATGFAPIGIGKPLTSKFVIFTPESFLKQECLKTKTSRFSVV